MQLHRGNQNCESLFNATIFSNGQVISLWGNLLRSVPHIKFDVKTKFHRYLDHCVLSLLPSKLQELWPIVWVTEKPRAQEPWKDSHSHMQKCATIFENGKAYGLSLAKKLIAASWRRSMAISCHKIFSLSIGWGDKRCSQKQVWGPLSMCSYDPN